MTHNQSLRQDRAAWKYYVCKWKPELEEWNSSNYNRVKRIIHWISLSLEKWELQRQLDDLDSGRNSLRKW
jgi:hypothetical protein